MPERELSKEQYAIRAAAEVAYCFELNSLSGTEVLKMATKELPESNDRWGISFYVFYLHGISVSSGGKINSILKY